MADTRGIDQDELHKKSIATEIQNHIDSVTAVLILADGPMPRITTAMDYALFPKTLANNVAFLFSNCPSSLFLNFSEDVVPNILKNAPQFLLDNPIALQKKLLKFKDDPDKDKMKRKMREAVKRAEQKALQTLVDLFDWLDGLEPQPTTEIVTLYEMYPAIEAKITDTLAQIDQASAKMREINKLMEEIRNKSAVSFSPFFHLVRDSYAR